MDRAEKVRKYGKKKRNRSRQVTYQKYAKDGYGIRLLGLAAVVTGIAVVLFVVIHNKSNGSEMAYVTEEEFASLMSFLMDDPAEGTEYTAGDTALTQGKMKECIQTIGLSEMVSVAGSNGKLSREKVMDYYGQILDYLDLDGSVSKKTILFLEKDGKSCQTDKGKLKLKTDSLKLEPFHVYEVYVMNKTLLGVCSNSDQTAELKNVMIDSAAEDQLFCEYRGKGYQIPCKNNSGLSENAHCTLQIKDGSIVKIKDIQGAADDGKTKKAAEPAARKMAESVRVLLLNQGAVHYDQVYLTCDGDFQVKKDKNNSRYKKSDVINGKKIKQGKYITIIPVKDSSRLFLSDAKGSMISNGYYGSMEIYRDAEGYYIVNEVNIEKYLYSVVASEMPSSFAPEALKAQAVCARSYVYRQMASEDYSAYHAQIDDSTNYQVYNRSEFSEEGVRAVTETEGEVMYAQDEIVNAYYFSASCGYTSGMEIWNQKNACSYLKAKSLTASAETFDLSTEKAFRKYIKTQDKKVFDSFSPYFRWQAVVEPSGRLEELKNSIQARQKINPDHIAFYSTSGKREKKVSSLRGFGGVKNIYCKKRSKSGAILNLAVCFEFGRAEIKSEYNIRSVLGCALEKVTYADGRVNTVTRFMPSAYFSISFHKRSGRYLLSGGGNGHGMGMSQYAADGMADAGWDYRRILTFFYDGVTIKKIR